VAGMRPLLVCIVPLRVLPRTYKPIKDISFYIMQAKSLKRSIRPLVLLFIITTALLLAGRSRLERWNIDQQVLIVGNLILFAVTILSFYFYARSFRSKNPYAITRMMYGSVLLRMFVCLLAVFIYAGTMGSALNKGAIFGCLFLYFIYTGVEVAILMKMSKQQKNA